MADGAGGVKAPYGAVHLVGVGGAGMASLALALADMGCRVSGSDRADSSLLADLRHRGVRAEAGHRAEAVDGVDLVVYSAAVPDGNVELARARTQGIETLKRAVLVGRLAAQKTAIGIAGCHGHWAKGTPVSQGKGQFYDDLIIVDRAHTDSLTQGTDACVKVKIYKKNGR